MKKALILPVVLLAAVSCCNKTSSKKPKTKVYDYGVSTNLRYSGTIKVESVDTEIEFTRKLLDEFNKYTNSNVNFNVVAHESPTDYLDPTIMPDVLTVESDALIDYLKMGAISSIDEADLNWVGQYNDATIKEQLCFNNKYYGYPYSVSPVLMIYNKKLAKENEIDTVDKLFYVAEQKNQLVVSQLVNHPFYSSGILNTFNENGNFYKLTAKSDTQYSSTSSFNCAEGLSGAKLFRRIVKDVNYFDTNDTTSSRLAAFADAYNAKKLINSLGSDYDIAALPKVGEEDTARVGSTAIVEYYAVNKTKSDEIKAISKDVAKFLSSEYSQLARFKNNGYIPSVNTLDQETKGGKFVEAYKNQKSANSIRMSGIVDTKFFVYVNNFCNQINNQSSITDQQYQSYLNELDMMLLEN